MLNHEKKTLPEKMTGIPVFVKILIGIILFFFLIASVYILLVFWTGGIFEEKGERLYGEDEERILFQRVRSFGPCPPEENCVSTTTLYTSGKIEDGAERVLTEEEFYSVVDVIDEFLSSQECTSRRATDVGTRYRIAFNGESVILPENGYLGGFGCEELEDVDRLIGDQHSLE